MRAFEEILEEIKKPEYKIGQIKKDLANTQPLNIKKIKAGKVIDVSSYLKLDQMEMEEVMAELC